MSDVLDETQAGTDRRSFIKKGIVTAAGATVGAKLLDRHLARNRQRWRLNKDAAIPPVPVRGRTNRAGLVVSNTPNSAESKPLPANFLDFAHRGQRALHRRPEQP